MKLIGLKSHPLIGKVTSTTRDYLLPHLIFLKKFHFQLRGVTTKELLLNPVGLFEQVKVGMHATVTSKGCVNSGRLRIGLVLSLDWRVWQLTLFQAVFQWYRNGAEIFYKPNLRNIGYLLLI